jgi:PAS domain S-box-containing protein
MELDKNNAENQAVFKPDELFFSQTDKHGLLLYGNSVFTRISEYTDEELSKKPHNIIRHSDMPKTIFKLFWQYLKNDEPVTAYVKNKSRSGRYYWVLALAFPVPDGYISIRLKPSTDLLKTAEELYKKLLNQEAKNPDLSMTYEWFLSQLKDLGFQSYNDFMRHILSEELRANHDVLHEKKKDLVSEEAEIPFKIFELMPQITGAVHELMRTSIEMQNTFSEINLISKNMLISTIHLGKLARTVATISENLQFLTVEMQQGSSTFAQQFESFVESIEKIVFDVSMMYFQNEVLLYTRDDIQNSAFAVTENQAVCHIGNMILSNIKSIMTKIVEMKNIHNELVNVVADFSRISLGINVICVSGKIEITHLSNEASIEKDKVNDVKEQLLNMKEQNEITKMNLNSITKMLVKEDKLTSKVSDYLNHFLKTYRV